MKTLPPLSERIGWICRVPKLNGRGGWYVHVVRVHPWVPDWIEVDSHAQFGRRRWVREKDCTKWRKPKTTTT
jgi:hypothetical protein